MKTTRQPHRDDEILSSPAHGWLVIQTMKGGMRPDGALLRARTRKLIAVGVAGLVVGFGLTVAAIELLGVG
jgi:hypothetical protein